MSTVASPAGLPLWGARGGPWFLAGLHLLFAAAVLTLVLGAYPLPASQVAGVVVLTAAVFGLQLRHSLAAARGVRPAGWGWTFAALVVLCCVPGWWLLDWGELTNQWQLYLWFAGASAAMLLRGALAYLVVGVAVALPVVWSAVEAVVWFPLNPAWLAVNTAYNLAIFATAPATLYWSARLVHLVDELYATRAELSEMAVTGERRRISRDLHDLLGQSLSAISLKGELASRLVRTDRQAALAEIESLTTLASGALRDVHAVTHAAHEVSLDAEVDGAAALLEAAGIEVRLDMALPELPPDVTSLLAWAVREGTTNMLRHSEARRCRITAAGDTSRVNLEIVNDGARTATGEGTGLAGLTERAHAISATVTAVRSRGGRFRLAVDVPLHGTGQL